MYCLDVNHDYVIDSNNYSFSSIRHSNILQNVSKYNFRFVIIYKVIINCLSYAELKGKIVINWSHYNFEFYILVQRSLETLWFLVYLWFCILIHALKCCSTFFILVHFDTLIFNVNKIIQKKILSITSDKNDFNGTKLYTKFEF